jgi:hypothetical protein
MSVWGEPRSTARKFIDDRRKKYSTAEKLRYQKIRGNAERWRRDEISNREDQLVRVLEESNDAGENICESEAEWRGDKITMTMDLLRVLDLHSERCYRARAQRWDRFIEGARRNMERKGEEKWTRWEVWFRPRINQMCRCSKFKMVKAKLWDLVLLPVNRL